MGPNETYKFCTTKKTISKMKRQICRLGENIYKWCNQQGLKFQDIQTGHKTQQRQNKQQNRVEDLNKHFSKEDIQVVNRYRKKMFNIINHQENSSQNHNEISLHIRQNDCDQKDKK